MSNGGLLYKDKPLFGLDIGYSSAKVMQLDKTNKKDRVVSGYGFTSFEAGNIKDGVIADMEALAAAIHNLFEKQIIGDITTRRVAMAIPAVRTFNRSVTLPRLAPKDLDEAVRLEAEQYIPVPLNDLYIDHHITSTSDTETEILAVAAPKKMVDSYVQLAAILNLEVVTLETTIAATSRLFLQAEQSDITSVLIDFGSVSADITIYAKDLVVTGTVPCGGDIFTDIIAKKLGVTHAEAHIIKTKYGLGVSKKQADITESLLPVLDLLLKELRRMIRYYEERSGNGVRVAQVVTMGGGANMPGLSEFMTSALRLPVRMCDPWQNLSFGGLQPPSTVEKSIYVTVAGLALLQPGEIFS